LNAEEEIVLEELAEGLREMGVDPGVVLGKAVGKGAVEGRALSKEEIIRVQEIIIARLQQEILEK
jgi:hypothetical protein